ncbi:MAG: ATP-grasp domain-containing protein [Microcoleaceae cyanobacterium]
MDLLEYQAKTLFRQMDIPVLPSQRIDQAQDIKGLKIPYPVVLKSQVKAGGRGKAGGIKFVENTIDAVAAAQAIFNLPIVNEYPQVLLAEAKYDADQELYLAVVLDMISRRPLLLGSRQGGVDLETTLSEVQQVIVDQAFSPFYARKLMVKMGLQDHLILAVSEIVEKMYRLFIEKDLDLVEINPLGISPKGEVMALDGKVIVNNMALKRHRDLIELMTNSLTSQPSQPMKNGSFLPVSALKNARNEISPTIDFVELQGNIGVLCNGAALSLSTLDLIIQAQGKPANFVNLSGEDYFELTDSGRERLYQGLDRVSQSTKVKVILINLVTHQNASHTLMSEILSYLKRKTYQQSFPSVVLRLALYPSEINQQQLVDLPIEIYQSLDDAVKQAVNLAK